MTDQSEDVEESTQWNRIYRERNWVAKLAQNYALSFAMILILNSSKVCGCLVV